MARKMKDSGIEWIGEIPEGWELRKGKSLYRVATGKLDANAENPDGDYPFFTCSMAPKRINSYSFDCEALLVAGNGLVGFTQYYKGKFDAYQRTYVLSDFRNVLPSFLRYYVSVGLPMEVQPKSIGSVIQFIKLGDLLNFNIVLPSIEQQNTISNYLESRLFQINTILSKTRSSIAEYKKLKQTIIMQSITKGVCVHHEMKDSKIEWLGEIPREWKCIKIKYLFEIKKRIAGKEGYTVLSITQDGIKPKNISSNEGQLADNYSNYQLLYSGEFAMNHMDLLTGWVDISNYNGVTSPDYRVFSLSNSVTNYPKYFLYLMQMCYFNRIFYSMAQGVSHLGRWRLQGDKFLNCVLPVPSVVEQKEIADYLDTKCSEIDGLIAKKEQLVKELESYKKSLIYEVVTGKREV